MGIFGSPLSNEWRLIEEHFKLTNDELIGLARKGIDVIFGPEEEKNRLRQLMWGSCSRQLQTGMPLQSLCSRAV